MEFLIHSVCLSFFKKCSFIISLHCKLCLGHLMPLGFSLLIFVLRHPNGFLFNLFFLLFLRSNDLLGYVFNWIILVQFSQVPAGPFQYIHFGLFLFSESFPGLQFVLFSCFIFIFRISNCTYLFSSSSTTLLLTHFISLLHFHSFGFFPGLLQCSLVTFYLYLFSVGDFVI